jgi:hypothetical protein
VYESNIDNDICIICLYLSLFDENIKFYFTFKTKFHFRPGFGSGSAFAQKPGSGSVYNECGSETLVLSPTLPQSIVRI